MDLFDYLRKGKINTFEEPFPISTGSASFAAFGENVNSPFLGLLGMVKKLDDTTAAKFSNTATFTFRNGVYQLVRSDPTSVVANWVLGRPVFWTSKTLYKVSPTAADATVEFAGMALGPLTVAGSFKIIQIDGEAPALLSAVLTKAAPAINDPVVLKFAANLGDVDVELDATSWTNAILKRHIGFLDEAATAATVKRIVLTNARYARNRGIFT